MAHTNANVHRLALGQGNNDQGLLAAAGQQYMASIYGKLKLSLAYYTGCPNKFGICLI